MKLAVFSHKVCWASEASPSGYLTDGGFPVQMAAISELFSATNLVVPCAPGNGIGGLSPVRGKNLNFTPLALPKGVGLGRKLGMLFWLLKNGSIIFREVRKADAIHAPIPGDVGTIGMLVAWLLNKPLFVRHCGDWTVQRTLAERFWRWFMERFAGGRNVMLATGGALYPPSNRNPHVQWIFSTSLRSDQMLESVPRQPPGDGTLRLIIACRQEVRKGTDIVIASFPLILETFPKATLDIVGGGSQLEHLRRLATSLGLDKSVIFHGKVPQERVLELLRGAHVFCYPTSASEGFPKVVLEALSCGLPVITSKISVLPKLMRTGCGVLLNAITPRALEAAVATICSNDEHYLSMSVRAIETAREYTLENWRDFIGRVLRDTWKVSDLSAPLHINE